MPLLRRMTNRPRSARKSVHGAWFCACLYAGLCACLCACLCARAAHGRQTAAPPPPALPPLTVQQERDLAFYRAILENPTNHPDTRIGAADRLLGLDVPQAVEVLDGALRHGAPPVRRSVVEALRLADEPVPGLLDGAVHALRTAEPEVLDQLAIIINRYGDEGLSLVVELARDTSVPVVERVGAITALGHFPTRASGDELIGLADPFHGEHEEIRVAAFASLRRLSPANFGTDFDKWRGWWQGVRDMSQEEWAREVVRQYQERNARLERENADLARRFVEVLRGLHRTLDVPAQLERVRQDLDDPLVPVRDLAIERIERLMRDSVTIPDPVRAKLVERLDDKDASIRVRAMNVLDELDQPDLARLVAARLPAENDRAVLIRSLEVLTRRPTTDAVDALVALADAEVVGVAAADALWAFVCATEIPIESRHAALIAVRSAVGRRAPAATGQSASARHLPGLIRLLAFLGEEPDLLVVEPFLDDENPALRRAVAEGLALRGRRRPLLDRANDPAVFPSAVRAIAAGPADLASFQQLAGLTPPEGLHDTWAEGIRTLAASLEPGTRLDADRTLRRLEYADAALRSIVLLPLTGLPPDAMPPAYRVETLETLTPLLLAQGEALRAYEILDSFNGIDGFPSLAEARFRAALCAGRFDAAAQLRPAPGAWLAALGDLVEGKTPGAQSVSEEIERRYGGSLDARLRASLDAARRQLEPTAVVEQEETHSP